MFEKILTIFGLDGQTNYSDSSIPEIDTDKLVKKIRLREEQNDIPQGKQIYSFEVEGYSVTLDREFTGKYRISALVGPHKVFGFSVTPEKLTDDQLASIFEQVISFLTKEPSASNLPENELYKAHFFGNP